MEHEKKSDTEIIRPTIVDINLDALVANFGRVRQIAAPARVMPILKANAYGHGMIACARVLESAGADSFGVAFLEEAVALRRCGITVPILVLGGLSGRQIDHFLNYRIDFTASSVFKLEAIDSRARELGTRARVHLKIDTGMERIGVHYYTAQTILEKAASCTNCDIAGVFSHFADSESEDISSAMLQLERFLEALSFFEKNSLPLPARHMANSGGILQIPQSRLDIVRPGVILYGVSPAPHLVHLSPQERVMSVRSEVVFFKVVEQGAGVSYGHTWHAPERTRMVTVPAGYGDGYPRRLSNRGSVIIRGRKYPIAGRVCMDQFMVDIGPEGVAYNGDEVILLGESQGERVTVEEISALVETDPRDVMSSLNMRLPRRFTYEGKVWSEGL